MPKQAEISLPKRDGEQPLIEGMILCCEWVMKDWLRQREKKICAPRRIAASMVAAVSGVILKPGYSGIRLKQIAVEARVTEGSIYRIFGDKDSMSNHTRHCILAQIVKATRDLINQWGPMAVTLARVAEMAGRSAEELQFLFPSRELLIDYALSGQKLPWTAREQ
jgi:AcrR family transcriptional regulator